MTSTKAQIAAAGQVAAAGRRAFARLREVAETCRHESPHDQNVLDHFTEMKGEMHKIGVRISVLERKNEELTKLGYTKLQPDFGPTDRMEAAWGELTRMGGSLELSNLTDLGDFIYSSQILNDEISAQTKELTAIKARIAELEPQYHREGELKKLWKTANGFFGYIINYASQCSEHYYEAPFDPKVALHQSHQKKVERYKNKVEEVTAQVERLGAELTRICATRQHTVEWQNLKALLLGNHWNEDEPGWVIPVNHSIMGFIPGLEEIPSSTHIIETLRSLVDNAQNYAKYAHRVQQLNKDDTQCEEIVSAFESIRKVLRDIHFQVVELRAGLPK